MSTNTGSETPKKGRSMNGGTAQQGDRLQDAATSLADQATRTAETQATNTMSKAGESLQQVAKAIRDTGQSLREQRPEFAGIADTAAQKVEEASTYLQQHDAGEVVSNLQDWARRQPAMVIAGGLGLGLLAGRFLRSGSSSGQGFGQGSYAQGYGQGYQGSYGSSYGASSGYGMGASGYGTSADIGSTDSDTLAMDTAGLSDTGADDEFGGTAGSGTADVARGG